MPAKQVTVDCDDLSLEEYTFLCSRESAPSVFTRGPSIPPLNTGLPLAPGIAKRLGMVLIAWVCCEVSVNGESNQSAKVIRQTNEHFTTESRFDVLYYVYSLAGWLASETETDYSRLCGTDPRRLCTGLDYRP